MQNIDPVYLLFPIITVSFSFGLVIYWHFRRSFTVWVLAFSAIAYFAAIALKTIVQIPTLASFESAVGGNLVALGVYYGSQTVIFEVGGAYVVAYFAVRWARLSARDAEGYGLGLALWENGVLIGALTLVSWISDYAILSSGTSSTSQLVYNALSQASPGLFYPPLQALPLVGLDVLERISSLLAHFSWGYLCILAVVYHRKLFLALALPMGLLDFFVPFAGVLGVDVFEFLMFALSVLFLVVALTATRKLTGKENLSTAASPTLSNSRSSSTQSFGYLNFRRAMNYGRIYLIVGIVTSILISARLTGAVGAAAPAKATQAVTGTSVTILPIFAIIASLGGLMVFVSDKDKGVYEYLMAYGVNISSIFWSIVLATIGLATIVLVISISSIIVMWLASGIAISYTFVELVLFYVIPMSYTTTMLGCMVGMIWSSLATRRTGLNSPAGVAPFVGFVPVMAVVFLSSLIKPSYFIPFVGGVSLALLVAVVLMIGISNKKIVRERFLSSA